MPAIALIQQRQHGACVDQCLSGHSGALGALSPTPVPVPSGRAACPTGFRNSSPPPHAVSAVLLLHLPPARFSLASPGPPFLKWRRKALAAPAPPALPRSSGLPINASYRLPSSCTTIVVHKLPAGNTSCSPDARAVTLAPHGGYPVQSIPAPPLCTATMTAGRPPRRLLHLPLRHSHRHARAFPNRNESLRWTRIQDTAPYQSLTLPGARTL